MDNDQVIAVNEEQAANGEAAAAEAPKKATRTRRKAVPKAKEADTDSASALPDLQQPAVDEPVPGAQPEGGARGSCRGAQGARAPDPLAEKSSRGTVARFRR